MEAGLDPQFTLLEPLKAGSLLAELTDDVLRDRPRRARSGDARPVPCCSGSRRCATWLRLLAGHRDAAQLAEWKDRTPEEQVASLGRVSSRADRSRGHAARRRKRAGRGSCSICCANTVPSEPTVQAQRTAILRNLAAWQDGKTAERRPGGRFADAARQRPDQEAQPGKTWPSPEDYANFRDVCKELRERVIDRLSRRWPSTRRRLCRPPRRAELA